MDLMVTSVLDVSWPEVVYSEVVIDSPVFYFWAMWYVAGIACIVNIIQLIRWRDNN